MNKKDTVNFATIGYVEVFSRKAEFLFTINI